MSELTDSLDQQPLDAKRQRLRIQVDWTWTKEKRTLEWFGLCDGMAVLELGSGPGFVTEKLLELLPSSPVTAVEIDPSFLAWSKQYLHGRAADRLRFVQASAIDTGLPDSSFDFAIARYLFQHLPDPVSAAKEVLRVLKPGGKLVIIDNDKGMLGVLDPQVPLLETMMERRSQAHAARGGDAMVGRRLWRILKNAGFQQLDLEAIVFHSDELGLQAFSEHFSVDRIAPFFKAGLATQQEVDELRRSLEAFFASPDALIVQVLLMACGVKEQ